MGHFFCFLEWHVCTYANGCMESLHSGSHANVHFLAQSIAAVFVYGQRLILRIDVQYCFMFQTERQSIKFGKSDWNDFV